jgi:DNA-binding CsgD family transcriptional regulator
MRAMIHIEFAVCVASFVLTCCSGVISLAAHRFGKGESFLYIGYCSFGLAGMVGIYVAIAYVFVAGIVLEFPADLIVFSGAYVSIPWLWYLVCRSLYRLMSVRWNRGKRAVHFLIAVSPLPFHLLSLCTGSPARPVLEGFRDYLVAGQALIFLYILLRYRRRLKDGDVKRLVDTALALLAAFAPLFVIENVFDQIKTLYAPLRLVWPSILLLLFLMILAVFRFVIASVMKPPDPTDRKPGLAFFSAYGLTEREADVAALRLERLSYREIGERLFISLPTVKSHVSNSLRKMGVATRAEMAELAEGFEN